MEEYAGFGPGAHSDFGGVRYGYVRDLDGYIAGRLVLSESEGESTLARDYEYVMLSLRTAAARPAAPSRTATAAVRAPWRSCFCNTRGRGWPSGRRAAGG